MVRLVNRAKMITATTGTGPITLGSAIDGYQSFADAGVVDGDEVRYTIEDGLSWEIGSGTYTSSGTTLTRNVDESSIGGTKITLSGSAQVFLTAANADISPTGGGTNRVFYQNDQVVTEDYTIPADKNAMSVGPLTVDAGVTVTVESDARYVVI
jgi:hypothetical protein